MEDGFEDTGWAKIGVAAALSKEYETDQRAYLQLLAQSLEKSFPGKVQSKTKGYFSSKRIVALEVNLDDMVYTIQDPGSGNLIATRKKMVRGIALKTETIPMSTLIDDLSQALEAHARTSSEAQRALGQWLGLPL
jgi:hypothetical protein